MIPKDILIPIPIHIVYDSGKSRGEFGVMAVVIKRHWHWIWCITQSRAS